MDVSVLSKSGHRSLRSALRTNVLGDGLLERTRSTSLALLGLTAAIGLAMVALALNQGWPLIAGVPIPGFEREHRGVGKAIVAAPAEPRSDTTAISGRAGQGSRSVPAGESRPRPGRAALGGSEAPQAVGLVVSHPTAATPASGGPSSETPAAPAPVAQQTAPTPSPTPAPAAVPVSSSNSPSPDPAVGNAPEPPIPAQAPPAGHEGDQHGHGHSGHSHGHSRGGDDPETPESSESPETAPAPTETPPQEADEPEESEGEQSHASSWGHGGGHGYGHDRGHW